MQEFSSWKLYLKEERHIRGIDGERKEGFLRLQGKVKVENVLN